MIGEFKDDFRWLSNFATCWVELDGVDYPSVEHAYMSAKSDDPAWKHFCRHEPQAGKIKRASYKPELVYVSDWLTRKRLVMYGLLVQKFNSYPFNRKLLATGTEELVEGNYHGDTYWGFCLKTNTGLNNLGKMIMEIRATIDYEPSISFKE